MQQMKRKAVLAIVLLLIALVSVTACGKETDFKVDFIVDGNVYATIRTSGEEVLKMPDDPTKAAISLTDGSGMMALGRSRLRQILYWMPRYPAICPFTQSGKELTANRRAFILLKTER